MPAVARAAGRYCKLDNWAVAHARGDSDGEDGLLLRPAGPDSIAILAYRESNFEIVNQKCVFADGGGVFIDNCCNVRVSPPTSCPIGKSGIFPVLKHDENQPNDLFLSLLTRASKARFRTRANGCEDNVLK